MKRTLVLSVILVVAFFALASSPAKADNIDFSCGSGTCTGTVVASGGNFSSTGIGVTSGTTILGEGADTFQLIFNTATGSIQITENGVVDFAGTITSFTPSSGSGLTNVQLNVNWTTIPGDVNGNTGTTPICCNSVISIQTSGSAYSVDVPILTSTVPEPSSLLLLGAGLLLLGTKRLFAIG